MSALGKLRERIKQKGLSRTFNTLWKRYVFFHWELLWMERDWSARCRRINCAPIPACAR